MDSHLENASAANAVRNALGAQRDELLAMVRRRGGTKIDAEEVLQLALQRALERSEQLREPARVNAWLGRVVRNALVDELRKRNAPVLPVDDLESPVVEDDCVDCWCVLAQAKRLKPQYATILHRVIVDGVPVSQIAAELGLTPNNAMVRLHRARQALKEQLKSHCGTTSARSCSECGCEERGCCPRP